ncbi:MAG: hypothetical protein J1E16_08615 [Muribaculaceae bacterium]|nr:hypothetical protein [Muribaculaceae bacterium]
MKKSTMILSALALAGAGLSAQAQSLDDEPILGAPIYVVGSWTEDELEDESCALNPMEGESEGSIMYRGVVSIPEGTQSFYIQKNLGDQNYGPATLVDGDVEETTADLTIVFEEGFYLGSMVQYLNPEGVPNMWVLKDWEGGELEITADIDNNSINISVLGDEPAGQPGEADMFIAGSFNDYAPEGLEIWALTMIDENSYRGTFSIKAADEVSFHLDYLGMTLVPGIDNEDEGVVAAEENVIVDWDDYYSYSGLLASTGFAKTNWVIENWEGGDLEVTVNIEEGTIQLDIVSTEEPPVVGAPLYISGSFNDNDPADMEIWELSPVEGDTNSYRATFNNIKAADQISFNFVRNGGNNYVVPGIITVVDEVEEVEASDDDVVVVLDDNFYQGPAVLVESTMSDAKWVINNWEGGELEITVNLEDNTIVLSIAGEEPVVASDIYIAGNFNEYKPSDLEIWNLGYETEEVYMGSFTVKEGLIDFYISRMGGRMVLVPAELDEEGEAVAIEDDANVEFNDEGVYNGLFAQVELVQEDQPIYVWFIDYLEGGSFQVYVNFANNEITIVKDESSAVGSLNAATLNDGAIYNLQGVRVDANKIGKGIYIINGKKVLVK